MAVGTGEFRYANLGTPVTLNPNVSYYIVSRETSGGDRFYNRDTSVTTTGVATVTSSVFGDGTSYTPDGPAGHAYGPLDFQY